MRVIPSFSIKESKESVIETAVTNIALKINRRLLTFIQRDKQINAEGLHQAIKKEMTFQTKNDPYFSVYNMT